jgi:hypothetical protein
MFYQRFQTSPALVLALPAAIPMLAIARVCAD